MKTGLHIEWRHPAAGRERPLLPPASRAFREILLDLKSQLAERGIEVTITETHLPGDPAAPAGILLFNGMQLDQLIPAPPAGESCEGCPGIAPEGAAYADLTAPVLRLAALRAVEFRRGQRSRSLPPEL
ncbi:MAG: DUF2703 domain-containing protein [Methanomicrobiaceae archaeon]|uniref:Uncharacterized protein n=1 Tax=hydrocarbon metagenome TaxID=938273 RepID=A0A0W8FKY4_9ZZZZ|nr:DUF2703 domain-containing protein [Methanomicrobiaceae archaeon]MDD5419932.1 hypothetical protein [Methanomicrobiaceae archaeon]